MPKRGPYNGTMSASTPPAHRGPTEHETRERILAAAYEHFGQYGYDKTTVSDLSRAIGYSKAYIYRFFESKQAIGEAICSQCLEKVVEDAGIAATEAGSSAEALRRLVRAIAAKGRELLEEHRKIYDVAAHSATERWGAYLSFERGVQLLVERILQAGRDSGEFERKTPLDESARAILLVLQPFMNLAMLPHNPADYPQGAEEVTNLILRSLAP